MVNQYETTRRWNKYKNTSFENRKNEYTNKSNASDREDIISDFQAITDV